MTLSIPSPVPALTKKEVAARAGYEAKGGGFNNAIGRLRTLELVQGRGGTQSKLHPIVKESSPLATQVLRQLGAERPPLRSDGRRFRSGCHQDP